jgi:hypothetical protein
MRTMQTQSTDQQCRRHAMRIPLPFEIQLSTDGRTVNAIIRDVSIEYEEEDGFIGVALLHDETLPLNTPMHCRCLSETRLLSTESMVTLVWTRHFGADGSLSGGKMVPGDGNSHAETEGRPSP